MKQTIKTKNYNATIQIPFQKLAKKSNCIPLDAYQGRETQLSATKVINIPHCHACCQSNTNKDSISIQMLHQLQIAFDADMKDKNEKIAQVEHERDKVIKQLTDYKNQNDRYKRQCQIQQSKNNQKDNQIKLGESQVSRLKKQVELAQGQKQKIMRTKIIQFQNNQLQHQRNQSEQLAKLQSEADKKLRDEMAVMNIGFQQQRLKYKQEITELRLSSSYEKAAYQRENERLAKQVSQLQTKISNLQKCISQNQDKQKKYNQAANIKQSQIKQLQSEIQKLLSQLSTLNQMLSKHQKTIDTLTHKLQASESSYANMYQKYTQVDKEYQNVYSSSKYYQTRIQQIQKARTLLLKNKQQMQKILKLKQQQIAAKDKNGPKVYEVKIQKVIDRKQYIDSLEIELDSLKRNNLTLITKINQLQIIIGNKDKQIARRNSKIIQLQQTINKLKIYIEQKQRSFAWIVQRQISRDILINKDEINKIYKVHPSQLKISIDRPVILRQQASIGSPQNIQIEKPTNFAYRMIDHLDYFGNDSTDILKHVEQSGMLGNVVLREVAAEKSTKLAANTILRQDINDKQQKKYYIQESENYIKQ